MKEIKVKNETRRTIGKFLEKVFLVDLIDFDSDELTELIFNLTKQIDKIEKLNLNIELTTILREYEENKFYITIHSPDKDNRMYVIDIYGNLEDDIVFYDIDIIVDLT